MNNGLPFKILVVEDDVDDREIIDEAFLEIGFACEVKKFMEGKALLHYLESIEQAQYPSLIVLDNKLPGLEATDLIVLLKSNPKYRHIAIAVYTSSLTEHKEMELKYLGATACFQKGSTMQQFHELVKELKYLAIAEDEVKKERKKIN